MIKKKKRRHVCTTNWFAESVEESRWISALHFQFWSFFKYSPSCSLGYLWTCNLGMDSKFPIWHVHLRLFEGSRILFLSGLHYSSSLVLQEFYNCKYENKNYRFGICTLSFCQPSFAVGVRDICVCFLQMVYCSCISNKMMI